MATGQYAVSGQYPEAGGGGGTSHRDERDNALQDPKRMQAQLNEEYHDPHDDWSARDIVLALMPLIIATALQDAAFRPAMLLALALSAFQLIMRTVSWDSRRKKIWPMIDLMNLLLFALLFGLSYVNLYQLRKWFPVIAPATFAVMSLLSLMWRRPWTAHYARYPKFDRGGSLLWRRDPAWRRFSDLATLAWIVAFSAACVISLAAVLTGMHERATALNVIFAYIFPFLFYWAALIATMILGSMYRNKTIRDLDRYYGRGGGGGGEGAGAGAGEGAGAYRSASNETESYPAGPTGGSAV